MAANTALGGEGMEYDTEECELTGLAKGGCAHCRNLPDEIVPEEELRAEFYEDIEILVVFEARWPGSTCRYERCPEPEILVGQSISKCQPKEGGHWFYVHSECAP